MSPPGPGFDNNEDALLIRKALHGDMEAFKKIIDQNQKLVISMVFKMIQQGEDREDICQEIFIKVYEKLHTFQLRSKLSTWIANITFNHCTNFLKKKKTLLIDDIYKTQGGEEHSEDYFIELPGSEKYPDELIMNKELSMQLQKAMEQLSVIQKTIIQLFHQNDLSLDEIAVVTALPVNTVKSHLFRARSILKVEMLKHLNS